MTEQVKNQEAPAQFQTFPPMVTLFKLVSGEYLIAETIVAIAPNGQEIITLRNPCAIAEHVLEDGRVNVEFGPIASLAAGNSFQLAGNQIVLSGEPEPNFLAAYQQRFAPQDESKLIVPPEKKLVVPV